MPTPGPESLYPSDNLVSWNDWNLLIGEFQIENIQVSATYSAGGNRNPELPASGSRSGNSVRSTGPLISFITIARIIFLTFECERARSAHWALQLTFGATT
jgi:hypothetical protein